LEKVTAFFPGPGKFRLKILVARLAPSKPWKIFRETFQCLEKPVVLFSNPWNERIERRGWPNASSSATDVARLRSLQ
jgi:hypothetical protein